MSSEIKEIFDPTGYKSEEARRTVMQAKATPLDYFVRGLKQRKAIVYTAIMTESIQGFNGVITLSSLLLQVNLFCRKHNSLTLLKQLQADKLTEAINSFYTGEYTKMRDYTVFIKEVFGYFQ